MKPVNDEKKSVIAQLVSPSFSMWHGRAIASTLSTIWSSIVARKDERGWSLQAGQARAWVRLVNEDGRSITVEGPPDP